MRVLRWHGRFSRRDSTQREPKMEYTGDRSRTLVRIMPEKFQHYQLSLTDDNPEMKMFSQLILRVSLENFQTRVLTGITPRSAKRV